MLFFFVPQVFLAFSFFNFVFSFTDDFAGFSDWDIGFFFEFFFLFLETVFGFLVLNPKPYRDIL